jgi:hypothetical protein
MIKSLQAAGMPLAQICEVARATAEEIAERYGCEVDQLLEALDMALHPRQEANISTDFDPGNAQKDILRDEWEALAGTRDITSKILDVRRAILPDDWPTELRRTVRALSMVRRVREVRALLGFRRLKPDPERHAIPVDLGQPSLGWYPGVEAWGEGIFLQLDADAIRRWETASKSQLGDRLNLLAGALAGFGWDKGLATPRFLLLHSLSHVLIRRLAFDAGYSASSIRERVYAGSEGSAMCGILLYTADGDSEGSLGGLVRMGDPVRFGRLIQGALQDAAWCSADPVCRESTRQGIMDTNAASCHACMLTSETSCSFNNMLLDRRTLVGISDVVPFFDLNELVRR